MNKQARISVIVALLLVVCAVVYAYNRPSDAPQSTTKETTKQTSSVATPPSQVETIKPGMYLAYDKATVDATTGTKLLFFHAPWCPQCRDIDADIQNDGVPSGVTVFKVDYDSNQTLRAKYGVTLQTTFVKIDANSEKIESFVAYEERTFDSVRRELLP